MLGVILVVAATFGCCYFLDKGYTRLFRSKAQHQSGLAVKPAKRYAIFGLILVLLGVLGVITGVSDGKVLLFGGIIVGLMGIALLCYYLGTGIYYDADSFIVSNFGKKARVYRFGEIAQQKLYLVQGGGIIVELYLEAGGSVSINSGMDGMYPFLDHAFAAWCRQKSIDPESCDFHDPSQSLWFPMEEV